MAPEDDELSEAPEVLPKRDVEIITDVSHPCPHCKKHTGLLHHNGWHYCTHCRHRMDKCDP